MRIRWTLPRRLVGDSREGRLPPVWTFALCFVTVAGFLLPLGAFGGSSASYVTKIIPSTTPISRILPDSPTLRPAVVANSSSPNGSWVHLRPLTAQPPQGRAYPAVAYDAGGSGAVMFGGCGTPVCPLNDTWSFSAGSWTNLTPTMSTSPPARWGAVSLFDSADGFVLLFGGRNSTALLGDTWEFHAGVWGPAPDLKGIAPSPRAFASVAADPKTGGVLLFGGVTPSGTSLGDTWLFSGGHWKDLTSSLTTSPPPRHSAAFATDPTRSSAILFGGSGDCGGFCGDTWSFSNGQWSNISAQFQGTPPGRSQGALVYDPDLQSLILFGGDTQVALNDTWAYSSARWSNLTATVAQAPGPRFGFGAAFDASDSFVLIVGGSTDHRTFNGTWAFLAPISLSATPSPAEVRPGAVVNFTSTVHGGLLPYTVTWSFGDGSASVAGLTVEHAYPTAGVYRVSAVAQDSRGSQVTTSFQVLVTGQPLSVHLTSTPGSVPLGSAVTFDAIAGGGIPPYSYSWQGLPTGCTGSSAAILTCAPRAEGHYSVSVTITDAIGNMATTSLSVSVTIPSKGSGLATSQAPASGRLPSLLWVLVPPLAGATILAAVSAAWVYRGRGTAYWQGTPRPDCYTPPEWSETPDEFSPPPTPPGPV